ncbi:MAG: TolC family protein [Balneolaceae bacterium]|nr:TolC family protein [Balneolaceae bacterium]
MKQKILLLLCFFLTPLLLQAQERSITLEEAIQIALQNNYQLKQAENNRGLADTRVRSAQADFLPNLSASFSGNRQVGRQFVQEDLTFEDRTTIGLNGGINTSITVFDGFSNISNLRRAQAEKASDDLQFERLRENVMFNTASRYLQVVLNEELLKISETTLEASESQLEQVRAQVEVGARPMVDLFNQESAVANDELTVIQRENALEVSKAQLIRIMQDESITDIVTSMPSVDELSLAPVNLNLHDLIEAALEMRSDLRSQEFDIESNRQSYRIARAQYLPTINASASIGARYSDQFTFMGESVSFSDQFFDQNVTRSIGFNIQIPIFTRWNNRTNVESAYVQLRNSELQLDNVRFQISEEVRQAYSDYQSIVKELESTEKSLRAAERAYETEQQRYEVGSSTLIELNLANANYVHAQSNRIQAIYNFVFQEQLLDYFLGQLDTGMDF